jgi:hypothetical protein
MAPKGEHLRSWNGSHDLKRLFMRFDLLCSSMLGTLTSAWSNLSRLVLPILLSLLLPLVFLSLDWFSWFSKRLDAKPLFKIKVFLALLDWILRYTLFHGFDTLGSHLREEGSLDYDGGLVRLQVQRSLIRIYTVNKHYACMFHALYPFMKLYQLASGWCKNLIINVYMEPFIISCVHLGS